MIVLCSIVVDYLVCNYLINLFLSFFQYLGATFVVRALFLSLMIVLCSIVANYLVYSYLVNMFLSFFQYLGATFVIRALLKKRGKKYVLSDWESRFWSYQVR